MLLRHVTILPNDGIFWHGALCVELVLGGQLDASVLEVVTLIDNNVKELKIKAPLVVVDGRVPDDRNPDDVVELVQVLRKKGYTVMGKTMGNVHPRWLNECTKVQVTVTNEAWLDYQCDELLYQPPVEGPLVEPRIQNAGAALKNLYIGTKFSAAQVFTFLQTSTYAWQITTEPKLQYAITLAKEGK